MLGYTEKITLCRLISFEHVQLIFWFQEYYFTRLKVVYEYVHQGEMKCDVSW